jgi:hypothetical protein
MDHEATLRRGHLEIAERNGPTANVHLSGDLLLLVSSWEKRCTEITRASHGNYAVASVVKFAETGQTGRRASHDSILGLFAEEHSDQPGDFPSMSTADFFGWRNCFFESIYKLSFRLGRPIDIVVDTTCLPKYYALLLLGMTVHIGLVRSVKLFYAVGKYASSHSNKMLSEDHSFTSGTWSSLPVPYLEGELNPDRKTRIVASIGFETFQARKFISSYEAERHILIMPSPGFEPEYEERAAAEAQALATHLDIPVDEILRSHSGSAVGACALALKLIDETDRYNDVVLCLGPKPHALGLGVAGLLRSQVTIVCRVPSEYVETETPATGESWTYEVIDLSLPTHDESKRGCAKQSELA